MKHIKSIKNYIYDHEHRAYEAPDAARFER